MAKLFIDSDIIIDFYAKRADYDAAKQLFDTFVERDDITAFTIPIVLANVHYILCKYGDKSIAKTQLNNLMWFVDVLGVDKATFLTALAEDYNDFEDSLQFLTAEKYGLDVIITRNKKDYTQSRLPVFNASEFSRHK